MPAEVRAVVIAAWQRGRVLLPPVTVGRMVPAAPDAQSRLPVHKPHRITYDVVEVAQVHLIARFVEAERKPNRYTGPRRGNPLVATFHVLKVVCKDIHQLELRRLLRDNLDERARQSG